MNEAVADFFDFPEDGFPKNEEFHVHNRLLEKMMAFVHRFFAEQIELAMNIYAATGSAGTEMIANGVEESFMLNFFDWFLYDLDVDPGSGSTATEIFLRRKKLDLSRREKDILEMMRLARLDLYEVREVHPGRGLLLRRLADGNDFPVVEMKASRKLTRWSLIVCRLLTLDGVKRLPAGLYTFEPERRSHMEMVVQCLHEEAKKSELPPERYRRAFAPIICQEWLDPVIHPRKMKLRNKDGNRLVFCRALFRTDDRVAVHRGLLEQKKILTEADGPDRIVWLSEDQGDFGGRSILGTFSWERDDLVFEVNSLRRYKRGLGILKKNGGSKIRLIEETKKPVEELLAESPPADDDEATTLPEGMAQEKMIAIKRDYYRDWLKNPIPALQGKAPLQAVRSRSGKRQVAELIKGIERIENMSRRRGEPALDAAFLWERLGLDPKDF